MLQRPEIPFDLRWRPFQLDPTLPKGGADRKEYLARKFGNTPQSRLIAAAIRDAGEREGITFAFDRIARTPNTLDCHRLIRWAGTAGVQGRVVEALFLRYFTFGEDISRHDVLVDVARAAGMDAEIVEGLLASDADMELVQREATLAQKMGVSGVPSMLFDGRYLMSGAEDSATLAAIIDNMIGTRTLASDAAE